MTPEIVCRESNTILHVQQVSFSYPNQDDKVLQNLSFSLSRGEFLGILGADGAGKTTLAKLTNGFIRPSNGSIVFSDVEGNSHSCGSDRGKASIRKQIGVIFADPENQIVGTTVEEDVAFGPGNLRIPPQAIRKRVDRVLREVGLSQYAARSPHQLSGGEQQKLCIAGILAMEPACLVFDEPVTFLDQTSRDDILELLCTLRREGKTILYLTHHPEELMPADRVLILHEGRIVSEVSVSMLWKHPGLLTRNGLVPSDMMRFRHQLQQQGYAIREDSLTPEALVADLL